TPLYDRLRVLESTFVVGSALLRARVVASDRAPLIMTAVDLPDAVPDAPVERPQAEDIALVQFTSGTAGAAKGVQLSHRALIAQTEIISAMLQLDPTRDSAFSWLPLSHDMGLIGFLLTPAAAGGTVTLMPTERFILRPTVWVRALSEWRATI